MNPNSLSMARWKVAKEAANYLYLGVEKEYKQAKLKAARTFGAHFLPTNLEVAIELDRIAEETEGSERKERLVMMRKQALKLMKILKIYNPILTGSVWRGTIHRGSDIDIKVYCNEPSNVVKEIAQHNIEIVQNQWMTVTKKGLKQSSFHIFLQLATREKAEIIVRRHEEADCKERCEIYGDLVTGLDVQELENILEKNPRQRFVPF